MSRTKIDETITISVEQCFGKKLQLNFLIDKYLSKKFNQQRDPYKKGQKISKINKRGDPNLALESTIITADSENLLFT